MTAPSHLCFAVLNGLVLASLTTIIGEQPFSWTVETALDVAALCLGALAPDLDSPHSLLSRLLPPARLIHRRWGRRTLLHSVLGLYLATHQVKQDLSTCRRCASALTGAIPWNSITRMWMATATG